MWGAVLVCLPYRSRRHPQALSRADGTGDAGAARSDRPGTGERVSASLTASYTGCSIRFIRWA